eukprot:evm.model.scf_977.2 EVM.evm.TU.scf_977.2   scf_977:34418-42634(-)
MLFGPIEPGPSQAKPPFPPTPKSKIMPPNFCPPRTFAASRLATPSTDGGSGCSASATLPHGRDAESVPRGIAQRGRIAAKAQPEGGRSRQGAAEGWRSAGARGSAMRRAAGAVTGPAEPLRSRDEHNREQARRFDAIVDHFKQELPKEIEERLACIVSSVPGLGPGSRVIDVGCGTGCLIPHLRAAGVQDILAVDLSPRMLEELASLFPPPSTLGNDPGVRTWCGDIIDLPTAMGPADAIFFNACFGNIFSTRDALLRATCLLVPGGRAVISHPLGHAWQVDFHASDVLLVPHEIPGPGDWVGMTKDLPLEVESVVDEPELYITVLKVPELYRFPGSPVCLEGVVVKGAGRGSKQMGFATANLDPEPLAEALKGMPEGVYFGWAQLRTKPSGSFPPEDGAVQPMVMNIGDRPTMDDGRGLTVEAHIMHDYAEDFWGASLRLLALGFLRPEMKFGGVDELVGRIKMDVGIARSQLAAAGCERFRDDAFFKRVNRMPEHVAHRSE